MNTDIAIYIVLIHKSEGYDPKLRADIIDENGDSVFEKKKILGSNEEQAIRRLALALKIEIMLREADILGQRLGKKTGITYKMRIQRRGTAHSRAVMTMTKTFESKIKAGRFFLEWMDRSLQLEAYDDKHPKKKESEEDEDVYEEESEEEFEGEGGHEKANQGKKRDKVSSGQHT